MLKKALLFLLFFFNNVAFVLAQPAEPVTETDGFAPLSELGKVFANVVSVVMTLVGFVFLAMLLVGGFRYMTAMGDPKSIGSARSTLTWAIAGLVFVVASFLVIDFIAGFVKIPGLTSFCIPGPGAPCP